MTINQRNANRRSRASAASCYRRTAQSLRCTRYRGFHGPSLFCGSGPLRLSVFGGCLYGASRSDVNRSYTLHPARVASGRTLSVRFRTSCASSNCASSVSSVRRSRLYKPPVAAYACRGSVSRIDERSLPCKWDILERCGYVPSSTSSCTGSKAHGADGVKS